MVLKSPASVQREECMTSYQNNKSDRRRRRCSKLLFFPLDWTNQPRVLEEEASNQSSSRP